MENDKPNSFSAFPKLTYLGSLDDKVQDYFWGYTPKLQVLNEQLIGHALFGSPVLLNDGYLIANKEIHKSFLDGPESIIGSLAQEGFIKIYMRDQDRDLMRGISDSAQSGVESHKEYLSDEEWQNGVRPYLEDLLPRIQWASETWPKPEIANTGKIFFSLIETCVDKDQAQTQLDISNSIIHDTLNEFIKKIDRETFAGARTVWENTAIPAVLKKSTSLDPDKTRHQLMVLANEAYHFSHAIAAEKKFGLGACGVQTALSTTFADFIDDDELSESLDKSDTRINRYLFSMPKKIRVSGSGLRHLMYTRSGIGLMKQEYIDGLNDYLVGNKSDSEMELLFCSYRDELADHLSRYENVAELKSGTFGAVVSTALSVIPYFGFLLSAASSVGSATVFRWLRKNTIRTELDAGRLEHLQNIPKQFRSVRQWRSSMMAVRVQGAALLQS